jgi:hypothetical protein
MRECVYCAAGMPLVAIEEGQLAVFHGNGFGTFYSCAKREKQTPGKDDADAARNR